MTTINYDLPVQDFIGRLDETEHVTHTAYRKDVVTIHHNGGRLSHEGVLSVWETRPASAHFNVDGAGTVAQFVRLNEYAWATGSTEGNVRSISIEQCNETTAPEWRVGDKTWRAAARLTGWIHARVFGWRPTSDSVVFHHHWSSTACAGPYMDKIYGEFLQAAQTAYAHFTGEGVPSGEPTPGGSPEKSIEELASEVLAGKWGNDPERSQRLRAAGFDAAAVQNEVNLILYGAPIENDPPATGPDRSIEDIVDEVLRGKWGNDPERRERLTAEGYDAGLIQEHVNIRLGQGAPSTEARPGPKSVAAAVIRGEWGNGHDRVVRLTGAGYDYQTIQDEVNRQLGY